MKIKKFTEKYEMNYQDDISDEYAYSIISQYFDNIIDEKTLQEAYDDFCEELEQDQRDIVYNSMLSIIDNLKKETINIDNSYEHYVKLKAKKYNL